MEERLVGWFLLFPVPISCWVGLLPDWWLCSHVQEGETWGCYQELRPGRACRAGHTAESHPSCEHLPALGLSYAPERLGRAGISLLADSLVSQGNSLGAGCGHLWECSSWVSGSACPRVWLCVPLGPTQMAFFLRECHCTIMSWGLDLQDWSFLCWALLDLHKVSTFWAFHCVHKVIEMGTL